MDPVTIFSDEVISASVWNNLGIFDCRGMLQVSHVGVIARVYETVLAKHPIGVGLTFIRPGTPVPKAAMLDDISKLSKRLGAKIALSVVVVEDRGPLAALTRSVIRGLNVLGPSRVSATTTLDESIPLLLPHLHALDGTPIVAPQLTRAVRRVREKLAAAASA
jgi:hypothetical protein